MVEFGVEAEIAGLFFLEQFEQVVAVQAGGGVIRLAQKFFQSHPAVFQPVGDHRGVPMREIAGQFFQAEASGLIIGQGAGVLAVVGETVGAFHLQVGVKPLLACVLVCRRRDGGGEEGGEQGKAGGEASE